MPVTVALMLATVEFLIATVEFLTPFWLELGLFVRQRKEQETHPVHVRGGLHEKMTVFLKATRSGSTKTIGLIDGLALGEMVGEPESSRTATSTATRWASCSARLTCWTRMGT